MASPVVERARGTPSAGYRSSLPVTDGNPDYQRWIEAETRSVRPPWRAEVTPWRGAGEADIT